MAIDISAEYPGQVLTTDPTGYPYGRPKNQVTPGDGTGTPWEAKFVSDISGFLQAILVAGSEVPTGTPDKVGASQYLDALRSNLKETYGLQNWVRAIGSEFDPAIKDVGSSVGWFRGGAYDPVSGALVAVGGAVVGTSDDQAWISRDDGMSWENFNAVMASGIELEDVAVGGGAAVAVGNSSTAYRHAGFSAQSGNWGTVALDGTPTLVRSAVYDAGTARFVIVGEESGPTPYVCTSDDAGATWSERSVNLPAGFAALRLGALATDGAGTVITAATTAHTKIARSTDGGATWADSTTSLASAIYLLTWSSTRSLFFAVERGSGNVYSSPDGDTWTAVSTGAIPIGIDNAVNFHAVAAYGSALVVSGRSSVVNLGGGSVAFSLDGGVTWQEQHMANHSTGVTCLIDCDGLVVASWRGSAARSGRL